MRRRRQKIVQLGAASPDLIVVTAVRYGNEAEMAAPFDMLIVIAIADGLIVDVDHRVAIETGHRGADVIGQPWIDFVHPDDGAGATLAFTKLASSQGAHWPCRIRHADGEFELYNCRASLGQAGTAAFITASNARRAVEEHEDLWHYKRLSDLASDLFIVADMAGTIETVNEATVQVHGVAREHMVGRSLSDFIPDDAPPLLSEIISRFRQGERTIDFMIPVDHADGHRVILEGRTTFDSVMQRWYTVERDVTERVLRERELEISQRFFELSASYLVLVAANGQLLRANPAFHAFVGQTANRPIVGEPVADLIGADAAEFAALVGEVLETGQTKTIQIDASLGGEDRLLSSIIVAATDRDAVFLSCRDITDEQRLADELFEGATRDQLTRLANRNVFNDALDATLRGGFVAAIIVLDLDDFKRVNDSLGHDAGDELLTLIAQRLLQTLRPDDVVARFGGDEFVILLRGARANANALEVAERVRLALAEPFLVKQRPLSITTSVGVAIGRSTTHDATKLFREADVAAYSAKRAGRNRSRVFDSDLREVVEHEAQVESDLRRALSHRTLDIDVQGIFSIDGPLSGVEALLRLPQADGSRSEPSRFLKLAGQLGLLGALGEQVIDRAFSSMREWLFNHPTLTLSLNIGPAEVSSPSFVDMVSEYIDRNRIDPGQLVFEITESGFMEPTGREAKSLDELRKLGVRVAVDEFGAGASSLAFLRDLRIDQIKIHRDFVRTMDTNPVARAITSSVVQLASQLGIMVVAAGVFTKAQADELRLLGCQQIQGFSLHKPAPVDEFLSQPMPEIAVANVEGSSEGPWFPEPS